MKRLLLLGLIGYGAWKAFGGGKALAVLYPSGGYDTFTEVSEKLDVALTQGQAVLMENGEVIHEFTKSRFMDGWLLDGCPLNVVLGYGWIEGQGDALADAGILPNCPVVR